MNLKPILLFSTIVAALGGFLFGFDTAVISGTTHWLESEFVLSKNGLGFTVASAILGTILGASSIGKPADIYGRKRILFFLAALYLLSALGTAFAWDWYSFLFFRFIGGIAVGGASVVSPMYISEISPTQYRGRLVAITQVNIVFGMLVAYFSNYVISSFELGNLEWRWMFGVEAVPAALFFILLFFIPASPRWLMAMKREQEARDVLISCGSAEDIDVELQSIRQSLDLEHHSLSESFFSKKYSVPIMLAVMIAVFNQLSGINAVLYYAPHIFRMAGAGDGSALLQSVAVGGTFLIFTLLALPVIDRFGRKTLMICGSIGYIVSLSITAIAFYIYGTDFDQLGGIVVLCSVLLFIAAHAFGQGTVIWVFISEVFPNRLRARGQALGAFTHWLMTFMISWTFPIIADMSGGHTFTFYAVCMVGQLIWVLKVMPETKGVSLEEIQRRMKIE